MAFISPRALHRVFARLAELTDQVKQELKSITRKKWKRRRKGGKRKGKW